MGSIEQALEADQLIDANGNPLASGGDTVLLSTDLGILSPITDNGDGSYTATLTSATTSGLATVTGNVNSSAMGDSATVAFTVGAADASNSTISAAPSSITADGITTSIVTVQLIDANGNPLVSGGDTVLLSTDLGILSPITDNSDGSYTAT